MTFSAPFQRPRKETSMLLLWWTCIQSGPKHTAYLVKRLTQSPRLSWTALVCHFGCPRGILSDQGHNSESRSFCGLCSLIGSVRQRTTPYHPQCDGGAERLIHTVTGAIAKVAEEKEEWDQYPPKVLLLCVHPPITRMLMFGREQR